MKRHAAALCSAVPCRRPGSTVNGVAALGGLFNGLGAAV